MIVLKIGGSMFASPHLKPWLSLLAKQNKQTIIIVPGGGPFADQVRLADQQWGLPSDCSHTMAVLGMQQYAYMLQGLESNLQLIHSCQELMQQTPTHQTFIWAPYTDVNTASEISKSWESTSDTIALWLAIKLNTPYLCLIKSAGVDQQSINDLTRSKIIDKNFQTLLSNYSGVVEFFHASAFNEFFDRFSL